MPDDAPTARLAGKYAVVTGAARGIGLATAERLLGAGATVLGTDLLADEGRSAFAELGGRASFAPMDVTDEKAWSALVAQLGTRAPDVLVNNAGGLLSSAPLHAHSLEDWERTLTLNLTSVFLGMRAIIPLMVAALAAW